MSYMFEVYYKPPADRKKEAVVTNRVASLGGRLDYREEDSEERGMAGVCLTFEFDDLEKAAKAAEVLRQNGEHVEGPVDYGP